MYFIALATDYDGTLAHDGIVSEKTLSALERVKKTGRKLILVTGRELPDLKHVFPELGIFDKVVAENGALVYTPASEEERTISPAPPPDLVAKLQKRGVKPLSVGRSIVATWSISRNTAVRPSLGAIWHKSRRALGRSVSLWATRICTSAALGVVESIKSSSKLCGS